MNLSLSLTIALLLTDALYSPYGLAKPKSKPSGRSQASCTMVVDEEAMKGLKGYDNASASKSLHPCLVTVSDKMTECDDDSNFEYISKKPCHLIKEQGETNFRGLIVDIEGVRLEPKKEYVLEVDIFSTSIPTTDTNEGRLRYVVKRVVKVTSK